MEILEIVVWLSIPCCLAVMAFVISSSVVKEKRVRDQLTAEFHEEMRKRDARKVH